jgi:hypothetical protein
MNKRNTAGELTAVMMASVILASCGGDTPPAAVKPGLPLALQQGDAPIQAHASAALGRTATDEVSIQGYRAWYKIVKNQDSTITLTQLADGATTTYPATLKTLKFFDVYTSFEPQGLSGQTYRLYQAAFDRKPDLSGLGYWVNSMQSGQDLATVAASFAASAEFVNTYGSVTDAQFVTLLYNNVLHRVADQGGLSYWLQTMNAGLSRPRVLASFSESAENQNNVAAALVNGFDYQPFGTIPVSKPALTDYVELLPDVFIGGKVDTHYSLVTTIQQLQQGPSDVLMIGNTYWDFSLVGLDRYRAGPQNLLRWNGKTFDDVSTSSVTGGIPNMFQVELGSMVGDFNGDGRLDVVLGGNGPDTTGNKGEPSYALLSQGTSGYVTRQLPNNAGLPGYDSWVHGGTAVKLRDRPNKVAFIGDFTFGPSYLVEIAADGTSSKMPGRLPDFVGTASTALNGYFASADYPVTAALAVDLDGDGIDELLLGSTYSYTAALTNPLLNTIDTLVLKQDAAGSFAASSIIALPNGPYAKIDCYQKANCENLTVKQITAADVNGDGLPDLLITHHAYNTNGGGGSATQLLINKGNMKFEDATVAWFGSDLKNTNASHIHSYTADLNGDGCPDVVLRGDEINSAPVQVFLNDCKGHMVEFSKDFQALMPSGSKYMHGGVPVSLGGRPAILLFNMMGSPAKFSVVRFKHDIPTPAGNAVKY